MSRGGRVMLICLLLLLLGAAAGGIWAWNVVADGAQGSDISPHGFIALGLGILGSLLVGGGLMTLVFISSRSGHDQAVHEETTRQMPPDNGQY